MTANRSIAKWGPLALGVVCVVLIVKLVGEINGSPAPAARAASKAAGPKRKLDSPRKPGDGFWEAGGVVLHLDELKAAAESPAPTMARNPFGYPPPPPPPGGAGRGAPGTGAALPPPPPPIPLKALGYSQDKAGNRQAYLSGQDEVYAVRAGDEISNRYKILEITPAAVMVEDMASGEHARLPIPQPQ